MTEYIIIVALIAVAAIGVYQLFGATVRDQTAAMAQEVAGVDSRTTITQAAKAANNAKAVAAKDKGLNAYGDQLDEGKQN